MSETDNNMQPEKQKTSRLAPFLTLAVITVFAILVVRVILLRGVRSLDPRVACMTNVSGLAKAMTVYANDHDDKYPSPDKWCDVLIQYDFTTEKQFICPEAGKGRCHYAMNPNAKPNSPSDMVLLFETKAGWNQFGGPEILTTENHKGEGCNVAFVDTRVRFVKTSELGKLKWK